jgi:gliding motility-associated protein GldM
MNVFYIGVDNPVDISVPGVPSEKLRPSISGGSLSGAKGKYIVKVNSGLEATINVGADFEGTTKSMGSFKFRIKRVPDPVAKFAGKKGSDALQKNQVLAAQGVIAEMENFDFDLKFQVVSFDLSCVIGGVEATAKSNGNMISPDQRTYLNKVKLGGKVYIDQVKVRAPNGEIRTIPGVTIKVL